MENRDLVREGFRAVARRPGVVLGEIAWRWAFGAAAWVLFALGAHLVLTRVPVSREEFDFARRSGAFAAADFVARLLYDAWPQILRVAAVLLPGIAALWIAAASVGRAATLQALIGDRSRPGFASLLGIHFLRAAAALAALIAYVGAMLLTGTVMTPDPRQAGVAVLVGAIIAAAICACWLVVNWFLSLAPIFVVREGETTFPAIRSAVALLREQPSEYLRTATLFGLFRSAALVGLLVLSFLAAAASLVSALAIVVALALAYFAVVDWLYICRMAAFLELSQPDLPVAAEVVAQPIDGEGMGRAGADPGAI